MSQAQQIVQKSSIYAAGNILRGLASFLMLPVYTRYLTPADYGVIELISVVLDLTLLLLGARVAVGIFKFYSDAETPAEKNQVIITALMLMGGVHLAAVIVIAIFNRPISVLLDAAPDFGTALAVYSLSAVFAALNEVFYSYLKILDRAITYVSFNLFKLLLQLALNIYLIAFLDMSYWGVIWSAVISSVVMTALFSLWFLPSIGLNVSKLYARKLIQFSAPIILASLAMYYITFSSRYYLQYLDDVTAVGIYALANKFGVMIFTLVAAPFTEYWSARQFDMAKTPDADKLFGQVFFYLSLVLLIACLGLFSTITDIVHVAATESYWSAIPVVPWLAGAYLLQAWGDYFRFACFYRAQNRFVTYASLITVVVVTAAYLYWIPKEGVLGAGKAIFLASLARFLSTYYFAQRLFYIDVPWRRLAGCVAYFAVALYVISFVGTSGVTGILVKGTLAAIAGLAILGTPLIDREHREVIAGRINAVMRRARA
jgi:O-antigen/teichoic acid export membrane protein